MLPIDLQLLKYFFLDKPIYHYKSKPYFQLDAYKELNQCLLAYEPNHSLPKQKLKNATYTIFDLETTGLIPEIGHEIISIGAVKINGDNLDSAKTFYRIVKPIRPVSKKISELTGLSKDEIKQADPFIKVFKEFITFSSDSILVAHPAKFDMRFLQTMIKRWKLPEYEPYVIDSQLMAKWLLPRVNYQLDPLIRYFRIERLERHHALNDAKMTAELFNQLLRLAHKQQVDNFEELNAQLQRVNNRNSAKLMKTRQGF